MNRRTDPHGAKDRNLLAVVGFEHLRERFTLDKALPLVCRQLDGIREIALQESRKPEAPALGGCDRSRGRQKERNHAADDARIHTSAREVLPLPHGTLLMSGSLLVAWKHRIEGE
jgi:hypothetical protein